MPPFVRLHLDVMNFSDIPMRAESSAASNSFSEALGNSTCSVTSPASFPRFGKGLWPTGLQTVVEWMRYMTWRIGKDYWLVVWTPLKNISQLGRLFSIYAKIKNVPNHQPDLYWGFTGWVGVTSEFKSTLNHSILKNTQAMAPRKPWRDVSPKKIEGNHRAKFTKTTALLFRLAKSSN